MQDIRTRLEVAFPEAQHPGNSRLLRPDALDDSDVAFLYQAEGVPWYALDPAVLDREASCLTALSDEGLHYVLPAYVRMFASDFKDSFGWVDRLLNVLLTKGRGSLCFDSNQFEIIDELLLQKATLNGFKYGELGSTLGVSFDQLVRDIRRAHLSEGSCPGILNAESPKSEDGEHQA
jgi:hypothetical protein